VWLVGGDRASARVCEDGLLAGAAGVDVVVVEELVVAGAEQDEVVDFGLAAPFDRDEVVRLEFARGGAAGVLAVV
jgi:aspartate oxidase